MLRGLVVGSFVVIALAVGAVIAVVAAAVTPTVDPVTMLLTMAPLLVLYVLSIGLAAIGAVVSNPTARKTPSRASWAEKTPRPAWGWPSCPWPAESPGAPS
mgnify:CR=1 FL=1